MPVHGGPEDWGTDESNLWREIAADREGDNDARFAADDMAQALFHAGWIEPTESFSPEQRNAIRDEFFDYAIEQGYFYDREDFDWGEWAHYMGYDDAAA